ncbi:MAG: hypothetical protein JW759_00665 [Candidatus Coatesbacteria bacterium]|nr:hypothetical protein [Candidatus Coatesbacteria bacterium]
MGKTDEVLAAIMSASHEQDGRIRLNCADAFKIAEQQGVELTDISRVCNQNKIRISKCQLGCFK